MTSRRKQDDKFIAWIVLIIIFSICFTMIPSFRYIIAGIVTLIILFIVYRYWKRKNKVKEGGFYTIEHHCPRCGRMNVFKYAQGHSYEVTVKCWYCHNNYTR